MKEIYIVVECDLLNNQLKIVAVYRREDRANSVCYLLKSQNPDKKYNIEREEIR